MMVHCEDLLNGVLMILEALMIGYFREDLEEAEPGEEEAQVYRNVPVYQ